MLFFGVGGVRAGGVDFWPFFAIFDPPGGVPEGGPGGVPGGGPRGGSKSWAKIWVKKRGKNHDFQKFFTKLRKMKNWTLLKFMTILQIGIEKMARIEKIGSDRFQSDRHFSEIFENWHFP